MVEGEKRNMIRKFKALALDLDGTLTDSNKRIPQENKEAVWKAIENGITIILASGRPALGIMNVAKELELDKRGGIVLAFNGGRLIDCKTSQTIVNIELTAELIPDICEISKKHGTFPVSYTDTEIVSEYDNEYIRMECKCNSAPFLKVNSLPDFLDFPVNKLMISGEHERLIKVRDELLSKYSKCMTSFFAESYFLETAPIGVGKDVALNFICNYLNISNQELMVCGDGLNDIPMFDFGGFSVGMKNSYPEAALHADVIIPKTNDECGVAYAIYKYILGEQGYE